MFSIVFNGFNVFNDVQVVQRVLESVREYQTESAEIVNQQVYMDCQDLRTGVTPTRRRRTILAVINMHYYITLLW